MTKEAQWLLEEKYDGDTSAPGFAHDKERVAAGEPLAYVIGWQPFLGLRIYLDSHPLIPRSETEWWTEQCLQQRAGSWQLAACETPFEETPFRGTDVFTHAKRGRILGTLAAGAAWQFLSRREAAKKFAPARMSAASGRASRRVPQNATTQAITFLDLCAGSGAIGCAALASLPQAQVFFGELDPTHQATIYKNIRENHLDEARAQVRIGDLFTPFADMRFDLVAANPPYIPQGRALPESVAKYESAAALYAGDDGLLLIRRILAQLPHRLTQRGTAWIEIDETQAEAASALAREAHLAHTILNDQYGALRVLVVSSV